MKWKWSRVVVVAKCISEFIQSTFSVAWHATSNNDKKWFSGSEVKSFDFPNSHTYEIERLLPVSFHRIFLNYSVRYTCAYACMCVCLLLGTRILYNQTKSKLYIMDRRRVTEKKIIEKYIPSSRVPGTSGRYCCCYWSPVIQLIDGKLHEVMSHIMPPDKFSVKA